MCCDTLSHVENVACINEPFVNAARKINELLPHSNVMRLWDRSNVWESPEFMNTWKNTAHSNPIKFLQSVREQFYDNQKIVALKIFPDHNVSLQPLIDYGNKVFWIFLNRDPMDSWCSLQWAKHKSDWGHKPAEHLQSYADFVCPPVKSEYVIRVQQWQKLANEFGVTNSMTVTFTEHVRNTSAIANQVAFKIHERFLPFVGEDTSNTIKPPRVCAALKRISSGCKLHLYNVDVEADHTKISRFYSDQILTITPFAPGFANEKQLLSTVSDTPNKYLIQVPLTRQGHFFSSAHCNHAGRYLISF